MVINAIPIETFNLLKNNFFLKTIFFIFNLSPIFKNSQNTFIYFQFLIS